MTIGLALSGGGVRGAAHVGALRALTESGIDIGYISGTSAGSIVASLYAVGYSPDEIADIFMSFDSDGADRFKRRNITDPNVKGIIKILINAMLFRHQTTDGLIKGDRLRRYMQTFFRNKGRTMMEDSCIPLAIPSVDINSAKTVVFVSDKRNFHDDNDTVYIQKAPLCDSVRASTAFPAVFCPFYGYGYTLCDGGIKNNLPTQYLSLMGADKIVAIDIGVVPRKTHPADNLFEISAQSLQIMSYQMSKCCSDKSVFTIKPEISDVGLLEFDCIDSCIETGYNAVKSVINEIKRM